MEKIVMLTILLPFILLKLLSAANIEVSTSVPLTPITFNPNAEKPGNLDEKNNTILNAVENYLTEITNGKKDESTNHVQGFIPQPMYPVYPAYNVGSYFYPGVNPNAVAQTNNDVESTNYFSSVLPVAQAALQAALKLFAKVGLFIVGGAGLLILGGIFTTLICYLTPICTITFNGLGFHKALDKETMRSMMTPEKIATAAALVQDAIGKYQRLQRAVGQ